MTDIEIVEGHEYDVTIPTFRARGTAAGHLMRMDLNGPIYSPDTLRLYRATITPVVPDEPPLGSVWLDGYGIAWQRRAVMDETRWYATLTTGYRRTWPEVYARGGRLIHDGGA